MFITIGADGRGVVEPVDAQGYAGAANNEMDLLACITALQHAAEHGRIHEFERVVIFTDSLYVKDNVPRALFQWPKRKWLSQEGRPIENATLWKDLVRAIKKTPPAS